MSGLLDKQADLNKEKFGHLETKAKSKKELEEHKKELKASEDGLALAEKEMEKEERNVIDSNRKETQQIRLRVSNSKKKVELLQGRVAKLKKNIEELDQEIETLSLKVPFLIYPVKLLGRDRNRNKYYFFSDEPTQIYVEEASEKNSLMQQKLNSWFVYNTEESLNELRNSLCPHGLREGKLLENINELIQNRYLKLKPVIKEESFESKIEAAHETMKDYTSMYQPNRGVSRIKTRQSKPKDSSKHPPNIMLDYINSLVWSQPPLVRSSIEFLADHFVFIEQEFSRFFLSKNCEWADNSTRQEALKGLNDPSQPILSQLMLAFSESMRQSRRYVLKNKKQEGSRKGAGIKKKKKIWNEDNDEEEEMKDQSENEDVIDEDEEDGATDDFSEMVEGDRWDLDKYRVTKTCIFLFGFYREKVRYAWVKFVSERQTLSGVYLGLAVLSHTVSSYINKKVRQVEDQLVESNSKVKYQYGQLYHSKFGQRQLSNNSSKLEEEKAFSRKERAQNRHKFTYNE